MFFWYFITTWLINFVKKKLNLLFYDRIRILFYIRIKIRDRPFSKYGSESDQNSRIHATLLLATIINSYSYVFILYMYHEKL